MSNFVRCRYFCCHPIDVGGKFESKDDGNFPQIASWEHKKAPNCQGHMVSVFFIRFEKYLNSNWMAKLDGKKM